MQKLTNFFRKYIFIILILIVSIPAFYKMFQPGIFSMQDFHFFRQLEFDKCIQMLQIPCRWAPDAGLGYGEPLFNYYGQFPYAIGEIYHLLGGSIIDSVKFLFVLSFIGSALTMFSLAKRIWNDNYSAFISATIYLYAPYRSVDVWVRGALPEAFSFIIFPLIVLFIDKYIDEKRTKDLVWYSLFVSILLITHNLSFVMFLPLLFTWVVYKLIKTKLIKLSFNIILATIFSSGLSAFYVLPVIFESKFVGLGSTTIGYFDYRAHFITLYQIFLSRFWGYGGSTWGPNDGLSLSVGQIQWLLPFIVTILILIKKKLPINKDFMVFFGLGILYIFLTHNKSTFIWTHISFMPYIQFPWRFLGMATFSLALASGTIVQFFEKQKIMLVIIITVVAIALNLSFFTYDIWYKVNDSYFTTGAEWIRQRTASIGDYWPLFGHKIPDSPSDGKYINYFPGWIGARPNNNGLIPSIGTRFIDTPIRKTGNTISIISILSFTAVVLTRRTWRKKV